MVALTTGVDKLLTKKTDITMGLSYNIKCNHCGTRFMHIADDDFGVIRACVGCDCSIETEAPIFCPGCRARLNHTPEELEQHVESMMTW